jgi:hypothetical protein
MVDLACFKCGGEAVAVYGAGLMTLSRSRIEVMDLAAALERRCRRRPSAPARRAPCIGHSECRHANRRILDTGAGSTHQVKPTRSHTRSPPCTSAPLPTFSPKHSSRIASARRTGRAELTRHGAVSCPPSSHPASGRQPAVSVSGTWSTSATLTAEARTGFESPGPTIPGTGHLAHDRCRSSARWRSWGRLLPFSDLTACRYSPRGCGTTRSRRGRSPSSPG